MSNSPTYVVSSPDRGPEMHRGFIRRWATAAEAVAYCDAFDEGAVSVGQPINLRRVYEVPASTPLRFDLEHSDIQRMCDLINMDWVRKHEMDGAA